MRQQDQAGRFFIVVELGKEGFHNFRRFGPCPGFGVEIAVAPGLIGADEKHLHAGLTLIKVQGDHVRLGHAGGVDALGLLHLRQGFDAVAQGSGAFKLHRVRRGVHGFGEVGLHGGGFAVEEIGRITDEGCVIALVHLADTGGGAAFDLKQQAGAGAGIERGIGAGAQQEHALQLVQGAVDGTGRCKGAEIGALFGFLAAMFLDHRERVIGWDQDVGKAFIIAQQHVVARL